MNLITQNIIREILNDIATAHYQIGSFGYGPVDQFVQKTFDENDQELEQETIYPRMYATLIQEQIVGKTIRRNYEISVADLTRKGRQNQTEVLSDTDQICQDIVAQLALEDYGFILDKSNITITPFEGRFVDDVAGHYVSLTIYSGYEFNRCQIPASFISVSTPYIPLDQEGTNERDPLSWHKTGNTLVAGNNRIGSNNDISWFLRANNVNVWEVESAGHIVPVTASTYNIGSPDKPVAQIYADQIQSSSGPFIGPDNFLLPSQGISSAAGALNNMFGDVGNSYVDIVNNTNYNAYPGLVKLADNTLIAFYGKGTAHIGTDYVQIQRQSTDLGKTWSAEVVIRSGVGIGYSGAQPTLLANGDIILAYSATDGVSFTKSTDNGATWSAPVYLTSSFTDFTAGSSRVVELASGTLVYGFYGKDVAETFTSFHVMFSTDAGVTWSGEVTAADGQADGEDYEEPNIVLLDSGDLVAMIRHTPFMYSSSSDSGQTWSAPANSFTGGGNPRFLKMHDGTLVIFYRASLGDNKIGMRQSSDGGVTWTADVNEYILDVSTTAANGMLYASPVEIVNGVIAVLYSNEISASKAIVRMKFVAEGGSISPIGAMTAKGIVSMDSDFTAVNGGFKLRSVTQSKLRADLNTAADSAYLTLYNASTQAKHKLDAATGFAGLGTGTPAAVLHTAGNISAASWTVAGINIRTDAATYTNTTSSGAVPVIAVNAFGIPTLAASLATTYALGATIYVAGAPIAGTNVTITNRLAFHVASGNVSFMGNLGVGIANPTERLYVFRDVNDAVMFKVENPNTGSGVSTRMVLTAGTVTGQMIVNNAANTSLGGANSLNFLNSASAPITFYVNFVERMRVDGSGMTVKGAANAVALLVQEDGGTFYLKCEEAGGVKKVGFFNTAPVVQQTMGAATAGAAYTATEQAMLQAVYDAVRNIGIGT